MANRVGFSYEKLIQRYYRPKYFKWLRRAAWALLLILALCVWAAAAG